MAGDTVDIILPERNFGRFDRGLFNYIFIPKGKWGFGITASYGELQTEDISVLSLLKDLNFKGKIYSVKPYISYFVRSNQAVGLKLDYSRGIADLGKLAIDFDGICHITTIRPKLMLKMLNLKLAPDVVRLPSSMPSVDWRSWRHLRPKTPNDTLNDT